MDLSLSYEAKPNEDANPAPGPTGEFEQSKNVCPLPVKPLVHIGEL